MKTSVARPQMFPAKSGSLVFCCLQLPHFTFWPHLEFYACITIGGAGTGSQFNHVDTTSLSEAR